jgi:hypothetical protein
MYNINHCLFPSGIIVLFFFSVDHISFGDIFSNDHLASWDWRSARAFILSRASKEASSSWSRHVTI